MTRKEKIERAEARVGVLYNWGGKWCYMYCPEGSLKPRQKKLSTDRASAMFERSRTLVAIANGTDGREYKGGSWRDYVRPDSELMNPAT